MKEGWNSKRLLRNLLFFIVELRFLTLCGLISSETLSKRREEMICPEQFSPPAMSFAEQLLSIGPASVEKFTTIHAAQFPITCPRRL